MYQVDINSNQIFEKIFKPWKIKILLSYGLKKTPNNGLKKENDRN
jgi:hypothetical protein